MEDVYSSFADATHLTLCFHSDWDLTQSFAHVG